MSNYSGISSTLVWWVLNMNVWLFTFNINFYFVQSQISVWPNYSTVPKEIRKVYLSRVIKQIWTKASTTLPTCFPRLSLPSPDPLPLPVPNTTTVQQHINSTIPHGNILLLYLQFHNRPAQHCDSIYNSTTISLHRILIF